MKRATCVLVLTVLVSGSRIGASVVSDFDSGLQGWTYTGDVQQMSYVSTGGNPGGYLRLDDLATGAICWVIAPAEYHGNWHGKTAITVDLIQFSYSGSQIAPVEFAITGSGTTFTRAFSERPPALWRTYGTPLNESLWTRTSGTAAWDTVLENITDLRIRMEFINGDELNGLDNVALTDSCDPTTIGLAKQMADGECVQVDGVVTRVFSDAAYMQSEDRSAGIRMKNSFPLVEGDRITVSGLLATHATERVLEGVTVLSVTAGTLPGPLHVLEGQLGGSGATAADPKLGTAHDLKETGLLIRTSGRVTEVGDGAAFRISDGSGVASLVSFTAPAGKPRLGSVVGVVGVSASDQGSVPMPIVLGARDIVVYEAPLVSPGVNLIQNNSGEDGAGGTGGVIRPIPAWTPTSNFTVCTYGSEVSLAEGARVGGGANYFYGGNSNALSQAEQAIDLTQLAGQIDTGGTLATLSADLAGYSTQSDRAEVIVEYYSGSSLLGQMQIGPQLGSNQIWVHHSKTGVVPVGTRIAKVKMVSTRAAGSNNNGYFDNLSLVLSLAGSP